MRNSDPGQMAPLQVPYSPTNMMTCTSECHMRKAISGPLRLPAFDAFTATVTDKGSFVADRALHILHGEENDFVKGINHI